jgi:uncharacterized protein
MFFEQRREVRSSAGRSVPVLVEVVAGPHCWINDVRFDAAPLYEWVVDDARIQPSNISGHGLVATRPISAGRVVVRFGGRAVSSLEYAQLVVAAGTDSAAFVGSISIDDGVKLILPLGSRAHFVNHNCDPNLWYADPFQLVAREPIRKGEELTVDYATLSDATDYYSMPCSCRSVACRSAVTNSDWQRSDLRGRYADHWVPALRRRVGR